MTYVRTFHNARPTAREGDPFTQVAIDEAPLTVLTWTTLETQDLDPVDADPENPAARAITTTLATLETGRYRLRFIDADGNQDITNTVTRGVPSTFATADDIAARLGRPLTVAEETQVGILLELATSLIIEAGGKDSDWADEQIADAAAPATYRLVCIELVYRGLQNPTGVESQTETLGAYSHTERYSAGSSIGLLLTDAEERRISRAVWGTNNASVRVATLADHLVPDISGPMYVDDDLSD